MMCLLVQGAGQDMTTSSLGSSYCVECPDHWRRNLIGIAIAAIVADFVLVAFILALNMTIAVGTLNGILFYMPILCLQTQTLTCHIQLPTLPVCLYYHGLT